MRSRAPRRGYYRGMGWSRLVGVGIGLVLSGGLVGCLEPAGTTCVDGTLCNATQVCAPTGGGCVDPAQVAACDGIADGAACTLTGIGDGTCGGGVCELGGCGNAEVDVGELCDDGNTTSGDGCRGDCGKVEACGDAIVDAGEACDDGNGNLADGCDACVATTWLVNALLAGAVEADEVGLALPGGTAVDRAGNVYIADTETHRIRRVDGATGVITTAAGTGVSGFAGDGGTATAAQIYAPGGVAVDGSGNLYIGDTVNHRVRRVDAATGVITTIAGTGASGLTGDGGAAIAARLTNPTGVAVDGGGNVYVADTGNDCVRRIDDVTGIITRVAGTGVEGFGGDGGAATAAMLSGPVGVALDAAGTLYIADRANHRVRRVDGGTRVITTAAGTGAQGFGGDGGPASAAPLRSPYSVAVDAAGRVSIADTFNNRIRRVDAAGIITTIAGSGGGAGFGGDGGAATAADLYYPQGVAVDGPGTVYIADTINHRIRRVDDATGLISTIAGSGNEGFIGDGGAAAAAPLAYPLGVAVDAGGNVFIADTSNHRIRRVDGATGAMSTVAGTGVADYGGDGGPAIAARIGEPAAVAVDDAGNVYLTDDLNSHRIRRIDAATGVITTIAGTGTAGYGGDGGPASAATLRHPEGLAVDAAGAVFVADTENHRVRRIDGTTGIITTIAGTGVAGFGGDGGAGVAAQLASPRGVAVAPSGLVYIVDTDNHRIRQVDPLTGFITTVAGNGLTGFAGDGGAATDARLYFPRGVALAGDGALLIADGANNRVRRVDPITDEITTVAGSAGSGSNGDGGAATAATIDLTTGVAVDAAGTIFVVEYYGQRIRRIDATTGVITTLAGQVELEGTGAAAQARLADPQALVLAAPFTLFAGGASSAVQALLDDGSRLETVAGRYPQGVATGNLARFREDAFGSIGGVAYDAAAGVIYLTETSRDRLHVVTIVDADDVDTWTIATVGAGVAGFVDGALASARFRRPRGLLLDEPSHTLYLADAGNHVIRAIDLDGGTVTTVAGTPATLGYFGDGLAATEALLYTPTTMTLAGNGDLFIADTGNHRVRRVAADTGLISTVLGDGVAASSGDGVPAWTFPVDAPAGLACDATGNLYVTSSSTVRLLPADADGVVDGQGAVQTIYGAAPRTTFPALATSCLTGLAVVDDHTVQTTDACSGLLVELRLQPASP